MSVGRMLILLGLIVAALGVIVTFGEQLNGGRTGPVILPGHSAESLLVKRVTATTSFMPPVGNRLTPDEIAIIRAWVDDGARETAQGPVARMPWIPRLELSKPDVPPGVAQHPVDRFVNAYLGQRRLTMPAPVSDRVFVRRSYLDILGLLPTPEQAARPLERAHLVETLLSDNRNYAEHWISFWNDLLRTDEGVNYAGTRT